MGVCQSREETLLNLPRVPHTIMWDVRAYRYFTNLDRLTVTTEELTIRAEAYSIHMKSPSPGKSMSCHIEEHVIRNGKDLHEFLKHHAKHYRHFRLLTSGLMQYFSFCESLYI